MTIDWNTQTIEPDVCAEIRAVSHVHDLRAVSAGELLIQIADGMRRAQQIAADRGWTVPSSPTWPFILWFVNGAIEEAP